MKIEFADVQEHLKINAPVIIDGEQGKIIRIESDRIDVEFEKENAVLVNHYDSSFKGHFEIQEMKNPLINNLEELTRKSEITEMKRSDLVDILLDEIETLKSEVFLLQQLIGNK